MHKGHILWWNHLKSFGFIEREDGYQVFFHESVLPAGSHPHEGDEVEFEIDTGNDQVKAKNVKFVGSHSSHH